MCMHMPMSPDVAPECNFFALLWRLVAWTPWQTVALGDSCPRRQLPSVPSTDGGDHLAGGHARGGLAFL